MCVGRGGGGERGGIRIQILFFIKKTLPNKDVHGVHLREIL